MQLNFFLCTTFRAISIYFWTLPNLFLNLLSMLMVTLSSIQGHLPIALIIPICLSGAIIFYKLIEMSITTAVTKYLQNS